MSHLESNQYGSTYGGQEYRSHFTSQTPGALYPSSLGEGYGSAGCPTCSLQNVGNMERVLSVAAGLGLAAAGLKRGRVSGLLLTAMGAGLAWRGVSGRCEMYRALGISTAEHSDAIGVPAQAGYRVERTLIVNRSPAELYRFWRRFENLPQVMRHLKYVETIDHGRSHWKAEGAFGREVEWDAEIINEREDELIAWRSIPGGDVDTAGSIRFRPLEHSAGTEVTISMKYNPPAGKLGATVASMLGDGLEKKLDEDLARFKEVMETGMEAAPDMAAMP